ncbi:hypothetical protein CVS40_9984 [Lucilia cuprina]|nr:hypothetical protein CVS40_9984 [Lucilia cuprina]
MKFFTCYIILLLSVIVCVMGKPPGIKFPKIKPCGGNIADCVDIALNVIESIESLT